MSLTNKKFSDIITSTRADTQGSCATYFGSDGLLKTKGYNLLLNSVLVGGVSGTPGTFPTSWGTNSASGTTLTYNADGSVRVQTNNSRGIIGQTVTVGTGVFALSVKIVSINTASAFDYISHTLGFITGTATFGAVSYLKNNVAAVAGTTFAVGDTITVLTTVSVGGTITCRIGAGVGANTTQDITISSPMLELTVSGLTGEYSETTTAANSGARLAYDPTTSVGVTGLNLWNYGSGPTPSAAGFGLMLGSFAAPQIQAGKTYYWEASCTTSSSAQLYVSATAVKSGGWVAGTTYSGTVIATSSWLVLQENATAGVNAGKIFNITVQEVTFAPKGLLVEESRTNLLLQSRDLSNAAWTKTDATPIRNQLGLDGVANSACLVTEGTALTAITRQAATVTVGSTVTASFVLKRGNTDWIRLALRDSLLVDGAWGWFNLATGAKGVPAALGAGTAITSEIKNIGNGWYRCALTCIPNATYTAAEAGINSAVADQSATRVSGATYTVDYSQLEVGAGATFPIHTTTATRTRGIDAPSIVGTQFSEWYNQSQGTFVIEYSDAQTVAYERRWLSVNDNTTANRFTLTRGASAGGESSFGFANGSAITIASSNANTSAAPLVKTAFAYSSSGTTMSTNGISGSAGSIAIPTVTQLNIGHERVISMINGHIRKVTYYPYKLPDDILQTLST